MDLKEQLSPKAPHVSCHEKGDGTMVWVVSEGGKIRPITVDQIEAQTEQANCPALNATCKDFPLKVNNGYFKCLIDGKRITQDFPKDTKCNFHCNSSKSNPQKNYALKCTGVLNSDEEHLSWMAQYEGGRNQIIHIEVIPIDTKGLCESLTV